MRLTGILILIIGFTIGAFTLFQGLISSTPATPAEVSQVGPTVFPIAQFLFAVLAMVVGVALVAFGGSGVIKTKNPAVRN